MTLLFSAAAAHAQTVTLVDEAGQPVAGAEVVVQAPSFQGAPVLTRADGTAQVDARVAGAQMILASKSGYRSAFAALPVRWPLKLVLNRATAP